MTNQSLGGMAEFAVAPVTGTFDAPTDLDDVSAAAFTLPFHVGYLALHRRAKLLAGETLLVVGGASAVGTAVIQLGVAAGADVIAVAGGPEKGRLCEELGAELLHRPHQPPTSSTQVIAHTDKRGADVAVDLVGGERTETVWTCMAREGRYLPVGFNDDPQSGLTGRPLRKVSMGNISVLGVILGYLRPARRFPPLRSQHVPSRTLVARCMRRCCELVSAQCDSACRRTPHHHGSGRQPPRRP